MKPISIRVNFGLNLRTPLDEKSDSLVFLVIKVDASVGGVVFTTNCGKRVYVVWGDTRYLRMV